MYQESLGASSALTDADFVQAFEACTLPATGFKHADHIRLAWIYLQHHDMPEAMAKCREGIQRFAIHYGATRKYHETVTCAFVVLIHERLQAESSGGERDSAWADFVAANPDLLRWKDGVFFEHYPPEILKSEEARRVFVLPRRTAEATAP